MRPQQHMALHELARIKLGVVLQLNQDEDFVMSPQVMTNDDFVMSPQVVTNDDYRHTAAVLWAEHTQVQGIARCAAAPHQAACLALSADGARYSPRPGCAGGVRREPLLCKRV